ncbi:MAG: hypothetical protein ACI96W_002292, partial [Paraglaciecola sp.]
KLLDGDKTEVMLKFEGEDTQTIVLKVIKDH